jgi:hypothetical protein
MPATFYTILTSVGRAKVANAIALNQSISLTQMAVGDGNGNPVTPVESQTALVRETYRGAINMLSIDSSNAAYAVVDFVVPSSVGGFVVREFGIFSSDGLLFAVGNFPDSYKPTSEEGSTKDLIVRAYMEVTNADIVNLVINPNVVIATRQWVDDNYKIAVQIPGGTTGQILRKKTNASGDVEWASLDDVDFVVSARKETQTLADAQTIVNLAVVGTAGMALYIEGVRSEAYSITSGTSFTLDAAQPAGTEIWVYQNDPLDQIDSAAVAHEPTNTISGIGETVKAYLEEIVRRVFCLRRDDATTTSIVQTLIADALVLFKNGKALKFGTAGDIELIYANPGLQVTGSRNGDYIRVILRRSTGDYARIMDITANGVNLYPTGANDTVPGDPASAATPAGMLHKQLHLFADTISISGQFRRPATAISGTTTYAVANLDNRIVKTGTNQAQQITLPAASGSGRIIEIYNRDTAANILVARNASPDSIYLGVDGGISVTVASGEAVELWDLGVNYWDCRFKPFAGAST